MGLFDRIKKTESNKDTQAADSARYYSDAISYLRYDRYNDALWCLDKAITADPNNAPAWNDKGRILASRGKRDEAVLCYDKAIELRPTTAVYYHNKGDTLASFGENEAADICFTEALKHEPDNVVYLTSHARMLSAAKNYKEADAVMVCVCELEPRAPEHWFNRATMLYEAGKLEDAIACYSAVIEIAPGHAVSYFNCGNAYRELGDYEKAVYYYDRALKYDRTMTGAMNNKGLSLSCLEKHLEAYDCFRRVLIALPNAPDIWYNKGYELLMLGEKSDAVEAFNTALSHCTEKDAELITRIQTEKRKAESA
ncbi:Beta-barrel assembly-enhancing protease [Methanocorpusculaceae archaeon Sp1]|nr:Beta-barrel assembly-enhancing protease [Methanocorpusculaceae archaeon Sp1]